MPIHKKHCIIGRNTEFDTKLTPCARISRVVLTENDEARAPPVAAIMQNAGKNAYIKSAQIFIVLQHKSRHMLRRVIM
jgi:hypothetical protein